MSDFLAVEAIQEILIRLPVKDMVTCTAVCKAWNSLIKRPNFISTHLKKHTNTNLLFLKWSNMEIEHYSLHHNNDQLELYKQLDCSFISAFDFEGRIPTLVVGCCNGLVLLADDDIVPDIRIFILWNPIIHKALVLPRPIAIYGGGYRCFIGFGFDSKNNDYKVLRICRDYSFDVELFSLNANCWKSITSSVSNYDVLGISKAVVNEAIHWIGVRRSDEHCLIVRFNVTNEDFDEIELPESLDDTHHLEVKNYRAWTIHII